MVGEDEVKIPYGINPRGQDHTIDEADSGTPYFCPKCREILIQRRGDIRRYHFAHNPSAGDRTCPWRTEAGVGIYIGELREDAIRENTQRIRLFLEKNPYSAELILFGSIPTLTPDDLAQVRHDQNRNGIIVSSLGTHRPISSNDLLPANRLAWVELDSSASSYEIKVLPPSISISGSWKVRGLKPNDFFIGDTVRAEFIQNPRHLTIGDSIYIISPTIFRNLPGNATRLRIGTKEVIRLEATHEILETLKLTGRELFIDDHPMRVDIVRPFTTNPRAERFGYVQGYSGSEALIAIIPSQGSDPDLELLPIPFHPLDRVQLEDGGAGKPRFLRISMDKMQSKRLLIHWPGHIHRDILLEFLVIPSETPFGLLSAFEFGVEIGTGESVQKGLATGSQRLNIQPIQVSQEEYVLPSIKLLSPKKFRVTLRAEYPGTDGAPLWNDEGEINAEGFESRVKAMFEAGARTIRVKFSTIGLVDLICNTYFDRHIEEEKKRLEIEYQERIRVREELQKMRDDEEKNVMAALKKQEIKNQEQIVEQYLQTHIDSLPRHVSRTFAKKCLGVGDNFDHSELDKWRSKIRRIMREVKLNKMSSTAKPDRDILGGMENG